MAKNGEEGVNFKKDEGTTEKAMRIAKRAANTCGHDLAVMVAENCRGNTKKKTHRHIKIDFKRPEVEARGGNQ